jgi:hypothetical protein
LPLALADISIPLPAFQAVSVPFGTELPEDRDALRVLFQTTGTTRTRVPERRMSVGFGRLRYRLIPEYRTERYNQLKVGNDD